MFEDKVFIIKLPAVNGLATGAIMVGEVTTLAHKLRDDAMKAAALKAKALLVRAQAAEILYRRYKKRCGGGMRNECENSLILSDSHIHHTTYTPAVMGTMSARSRKRSLPAGLFPILMSM